MDNEEYVEVAHIAEEVVVDANGGESAHLNDAKHSQENYGIYLGETQEDDTDSSVVYPVDEIQLHHRNGTDEMSVAIDLAKLSQGHYTSNDLLNPVNVLTPSNPPIQAPAPSESGSQYVFITEDGREATSLDDLDGRTVEVANKYSKPKMSYAQLICEAILHSKDHQLTLAEIYAEIHRRHPYYLLENKNWQNSIRHNLTLNKCFVKVPRSSNEGRGSYWTMEPGAENIIFRRQSGTRGGGCPAVANRVPQQQPDPLDAQVVNSTGNIVYVTVPAPN